MVTKTEDGNVTVGIPNTNLILVRGGGTETLICTSGEGITKRDVLGYEAWLKEQPLRTYKGHLIPDDDPDLLEETRRAKEFLKAHPIPRELYLDRE